VKKVTLDTGIFPIDDLMKSGRPRHYEFARISVTDGELEGTSFQVHLIDVEKVPETAVWGESKWGEAVWASEESALEEILRVISSGSFPKGRENLSDGQRNQFRDAMILEAHIRETRDIFVSNDSRAFINFGRRDLLEKRFGIKILARAEFEELLR
jgi:hypothetical protein